MSVVLIIGLAILFSAFAAIGLGDETIWIGALCGATTAIIIRLHSRLTALERRQAQSLDMVEQLLDKVTPALENSPAASTAASSNVVTDTDSSPPHLVTEEAESPIASTLQTTTLDSEPRVLTDSVPRAPDRVVAPGVELADKLLAAIKHFFTSGNVVVKVGLVVLFFGLSFLIKYVSERVVAPIELRLAGVAIIGLALLIVGWRLRDAKRAYAMALQGGGIGVLYLTIFSAAKFYDVVPLAAAFAGMFALTVVAGVLAVMQNAVSLAVFGIAGGFLAPVLTSTGQGSHVALFSYYAVLNFGIFGIAWFKSWRILNWLGFIFTFVIASLWGAQSYSPEHFASTEPFLILFTLFYVAITILFASRQPPQLKGLVDASLVFGVPTVALALQSRLCGEIEFALAYSALTLGVFYAALACALWSKYRDSMRLLIECFIALAVVFLSLAIPLAMDGHWTAAAWSLESVGIIWVGLRQHRMLARLFGLLLQAGAAAMFLARVDIQTTLPFVTNSAYIGAVMIALASLLTSFLYARNQTAQHQYEKPLERILLTWGMTWWFAAGLQEIWRHVSDVNQIAAIILFTGLSAIGLAAVARAYKWRMGAYPSLGLLPVMVALAPLDFAIHTPRGPFSGLAGVAWLVGLALNYWLLRRFAEHWKMNWQSLWHAFSCYLISFLLTWATLSLFDKFSMLADSWTIAAAGVVPAIICLALNRHGYRIRWPIAAFSDVYTDTGLLPFAIYLVLFIVMSIGVAGDATPLSFLPVLNPIEASTVFALISLASYLLTSAAVQRLEQANRIITVVLGVLGFVVFNSLIFRGVHQLAGVSFDFGSLWTTPLLQSILSISWTLIGGILMALAAVRTRSRVVWLVGAAFLSLVVMKLFMVDLADIGTVERIVTFMGVGFVLLVIGYFAPLPPVATE